MRKAARNTRCPSHHTLECYLDEYIAARIAAEADAPLFRSTPPKTGQAHPHWPEDAYRMIQRRAAAAAGIATHPATT